ncbi:MAG: hypothetical protein JNG84_07555 [Archangium sp.]|nr:hypothetical protein [Archangium sp.]
MTSVSVRKSLQWVLLAGLAAVSTGCPTTDIVCKPGTSRCGNGCVDAVRDRRNCGACGVACATGQVCEAGACVCQEASTSCNGTCVVVAYDTANCGACGAACAAGQVCEAGQCGAACTAGTSVRCGDSCIDVTSDFANCGGCDQGCQTGQVCRAGTCTFDLVAACFSSGEVTGFRATTGQRGPAADVGNGPGSLASFGGRLLSADGVDRRLYQAALAPGDATYRQLARFNRTGAVPNQVLVDEPFVYVVNAESGTLQVLERNAALSGPDIGTLDAGAEGALPLATVAELVLGMNTYPQAIAKLGTTLWVPLYGGFGAGAAQAGQRIARISVADPRAPVKVGEIDLATLDLKPFDGGVAAARPWSVTTLGGAVYVALNNLEPSTYQPAGPGLVARIDPATNAVSLIDLGADTCLNPQWIAPLGDGLAVSCGGQAEYTPSFSLAGTRHAGVVRLSAAGQVTASWAPTCPAGSDLPDGGTTCPPMFPGRFAVLEGRLYLGDQNAGRIYVLDTADGGLVELRGPLGSQGSAILACTPSPVTGVANVADVLALP